MQRSEAVDEHWIGEDAHLIELKEHGRVPEKAQPWYRVGHDRSLPPRSPATIRR